MVVRSLRDGKYSFEDVPTGQYVIHAETGNGEQTEPVALQLGQNEVRVLDLRFGVSRATPKGPAYGQSPEFDDEPVFTVAGVTDASNLGGHGSDTVVRTRESLAKDVSLLPGNPPGPPATSASAPENELRAAVSARPNDAEANSRLGKLLVDAGKAADALPFLERAKQLAPEDYQISLALASAYADAGKMELAEVQVRALLRGRESAELYHLLGEVEEKRGHPLEAVRAFQQAAELSPSENNLFDWGSELLLHRAPEPAIQVFGRGVHLYPRSVRLLSGLGVAWYARGSYEQAVRRLCQASDLDPNAVVPYLFMGRMTVAEKARSEEVLQRLERFVTLQPENAQANYYLALALRLARADSEGLESGKRAEALLVKATQLDPRFAPAYVELGALYAQQKDLNRAIAAYQNAIAAEPELEEAHYRLGQAYILMGRREDGRKEIEKYRRLSRAKAQQAEDSRRQIQQFVYTLRSQPPERQQP